MTDNVSKIKDRLDVVDVLSGYMKLQKAGINFKGRCPFHNEKTPSFFVSPERQIWHCFGCQKGGDMFEFVKEIESVEFPEALKILADKAGIELELRQPADRPATDAKQKLYEICELATKFFEKQFQSSSGKEALAYLHDRGLTDTTITEFRLGWAPNDWESLSNYLQTRGYQEKEIIDAGLAIKRSAESGREGVY
ncbi:MAG: CHC2 zinc finger domain-containing protein, partial [bacterium]|nr:CHC2 zinc finger domain-containing protein [bacterium]